MTEMDDTQRPETVRALMEDAVRRLEAAGIEDARRNAEWLLQDVLSSSRAMLYAYPERPVPPEARAAFEALLMRRLRREPLQYVLGHADFYGLRLRVTPDVLIPRPETEQVVEEVLRLLAPVPSPRVLDVGTGSGCIPLAIKHERPDAEVFACDVSERALEVARVNAAAHRLAVTFVQADVLAPAFAERMPHELDLLVSNPPYITRREASSLAAEVRDFEPHLALFAGDDPLVFYRAILRHARALLVPGGFVVFETHAEYGPAVRDLMAASGFAETTIRADLAGRPRIATGRWLPPAA